MNENLHIFLSFLSVVIVPVATMFVKGVVDNAVGKVQERLTAFELAVTMAAGDRKAFETATALRHENTERRMALIEGLASSGSLGTCMNWKPKGSN